MNLIKGKYKIYQKRSILAVSVNEGYVTETRIVNKANDNLVEEKHKVVMVHKDPPKVNYREAQPSRYKIPIYREKLNIFLLGVYIGVVLALVLMSWLY